MTTTAELDPEAIEQTVVATLTPRTALTAADRARRTALLRRPEESLLAGVCSALGHSAGVPVRLVRLIAVLAGLLGIGIPSYLVGMILLPRIHVAAAEAPAEERIERPLQLLASFSARPVDGLALLAVVPSLAGMWLWMGVGLASSPAATGVLIALLVILLGLLLLAARRAAAARRGLMLALLARRADLVEPAQLETFLREQLRRAPWAWTRRDTEGAALLLAAASTDMAAGASARGDLGSAEDPGEEPAVPRAASRARHPRASARSTMVVLAGMLAVGALTVLVLNVAPELVPAVAAAPLPRLGRLGVACAAATAVAGIALVILGARGRTSLALVLVGALALTGAVIGGGWLRLTHDPGAEPVRIVAADLEAGSHHTCPVGPSSWSRPVVVDLRGVDAAAVERLRKQQERLGLGDDATAISIDCYRPVGDLTVLLPADPGLVLVHVSAPEGAVQAGAVPETERAVSVSGDLLVGDVTIIEQPATVDEGEAG